MADPHAPARAPIRSPASRARSRGPLPGEGLRPLGPVLRLHWSPTELNSDRTMHLPVMATAVAAFARLPR